MWDWWAQLGGLNQAFFLAAGVFSLLLAWQILSLLVGVGHGDLDSGAAVQDIPGGHDVIDAAEAFHFFSLRTVIAFFTLFSWAGALYLWVGKPTGWAILLAFAWGLAGMAVTALLVHVLRKLTETGTMQLRTAIGQTATVYVDIPAGGQGQVRVLVSGVMSVVKARCNSAVGNGALVKVTGLAEPGTLEVEPQSPSKP